MLQGMAVGDVPCHFSCLFLLVTLELALSIAPYVHLYCIPELMFYVSCRNSVRDGIDTK